MRKLLCTLYGVFITTCVGEGFSIVKLIHEIGVYKKLCRAEELCKPVDNPHLQDIRVTGF